VVKSQAELKNCIFPGVNDVANVNSEWLCSWAIRTPTNEQAFKINKWVMSLFQSGERVYRSVNTTLREDDAVNYPAEFLDTVTAPGLPAHEVTLKVGAPIMLLRNINPNLCNGTGLRVCNLKLYLIECEIQTGCGAGKQYLFRKPLSFQATIHFSSSDYSSHS